MTTQTIAVSSRSFYCFDYTILCAIWQGDTQKNARTNGRTPAAQIGSPKGMERKGMERKGGKRTPRALPKRRVPCRAAVGTAGAPLHGERRTMPGAVLCKPRKIRIYAFKKPHPRPRAPGKSHAKAAFPCGNAAFAPYPAAALPMRKRGCNDTNFGAPHLCGPMAQAPFLRGFAAFKPFKTP